MIRGHLQISAGSAALADQRLRCVLFFGAPGTGKGTQGAILGQVPGFFHLSTGDMFRGLDKESELGREFLKYSTQGLLVPDEFTVRLWQQHVAELIEAEKFRPQFEMLILDGIPRTVQQAVIMDPLIEVLKVVHLSCSDDEQMVERLIKRARSSGRPDDAKEEVVRRRLDVYRDETKPVLGHYQPSLVAEVNAIGSPAEVLRNVLEVVAPIQAANFENALS